MKSKISYQLISYIFLISFLITAASSYLQLSSTYNNELKAFEDTIEKIEKTRLPILSQALWNVNEEAINLFLTNLVDGKDIIYAKVTEFDGMVKEQGSIRQENIIKREFPIIKQLNQKNNTIGTLIIIADLAPLYERLKNYALTTIFSEALKMFLIALLIIFIIKRFLTNSIETMAHYANNLSIDTLEKPLKITQHSKTENEVDTVVNAINQMRLNLLEQIQESRQKDTLLAHQSKLAAMGEMLGNIAHQWRQPLSMISSSASSIKLSAALQTLNEEEVAKSMDNITKATQYLSSTIDDFRDYFRPNKSKEHFNLADSLDKIYNIVSRHYKTLEINLEKPEIDITLYGYQNELIQVLLNLLNNAKDALVNKKLHRLILLEVNQTKEHTIITIQDNAGGIPKEIISRVFEPYFTTKGDHKGTGIGLYIAQEIITKHMDGTLEVANETFTYDNQTYQGAKFTITLPHKVTHD